MRRLAPLVAAAVLATLVLVSSASGAARLYVPSYGSGPPEVVGGFERADNGSLTPVAGSPFVAVSGPPFAVAGLLRFAFGPDGTTAVGSFLFNGGVQGMSFSSVGQLTPANSIPTRQSEGIAVAPNGRFAYEGTREYPPGTKSEGIRVFSLAADGTLLPAGEYDVATSYGEIAITPNGRFLFGSAEGGIKRFAINPDGSLTYLGMTGLGSVARYLTVPPDGRFLFIGDDGGKGGVDSMAIGADGGLSDTPGEPALTGGVAVELFAVSPDGTHLYMPDEGQKKVVVAAVAANGSLSVVGSIPADEPDAAAVSPDGRYLYWHTSGKSETIAVASLGADGMPATLPFTTPWKQGEPARLDFQPGPAPVASFTAKAVAPGAAAKFNAEKSTNAADYNWSFGDGATLADGGPKPTHVYAKAGQYTATLSVTDGQGCGARQIYTGQSTTCPGGAATITTVTVDTLPMITGLKATPKKFRPKGVGARARKGMTGTTFRYVLNEKATVRLKIDRKLPGRKVGGKCRKVTTANEGRKKCSRFVKVGPVKGTGKAGLNKVIFNGKRGGKPLAPGGYRISAVATDSARGRSAARTASFLVLAY